MYKLISEAEAVGKTVEKVKTFKRHMSVLFTDGTAIVYRSFADSGDFEADEQVPYGMEVVAEGSIKSKFLFPYCKYQLGIASKVEYHALLEDQHRAKQREERAEYERLKKIYEGEL